MSSRLFFFFQAEDGIRDLTVTGVQTCALPISQASDLETERHRQATAAQVEQFLRAACAEIAKESDDPEIEREEWEQAASLYLRQKEVAATSDGRRPQKGTQSVISR